MFHRRVILNHDTMLRTYPGADGFKTGYTKASGHNLVTSAMHGNVRLVGVVLGANGNAERNVRMAALLDQGFAEMGAPPMPGTIQIARRDTPPPQARLAGLIGSAQAAELPRNSRQAAAAPPLPPAPPPGTRWTIQVGTYSSAKEAAAAAAVARKSAEGGEVHVEQLKLNGRPIWRAQVIGLTAPEAQSACAVLSRHKSACFVVRPEQGQIASR